MRVVAGAAGGVPLRAPASDARPTMDRVKGAIFSSLGDLILDAKVLDLFAGSGALGIEALSRGCASCTFVDNDRRAVETIRRNFERTRLQGTVHAMDVFRYLDKFAPPGAFDLILADPPYSKAPGERDFPAELLACASLQNALVEHGVFVLEHRPGAALRLRDIWDCFRQKQYGATELTFLRLAAGLRPSL